jgi:type I restriction enzyme R subunit
MNNIFTQEQEMEKKLIDLLTVEGSHWTYREDLKTEEQLWNNFFNHLKYTNKSILLENPLTEQEKERIKLDVTSTTFFESAEFLRGENGVAKVILEREDASLGRVELKVVSAREVAGGDSVYEIINQFEAKKTNIQDQDARFDVTLLINGLPMIHIELKSQRRSLNDAFRQIKRYITNGKFQGIYSTIQMFVVSNGAETKYIAAAEEDQLNPSFLTGWVNTNNRPVRNYLDFAEEVLTIPAAHNMVAHYSVLDHDKKAIILLRPYQIHAIEAVKEANKNYESGYVWHTTGSGKTLTSYKVAHNLLENKKIEKTIFIVDRKDLDQQTTSSFLSYSENDSVQIDETDNVNDLIDKLSSKEKTVIITTIQKLNHVMRRHENFPENRKINRARESNIGFVVDEAHRAVTPWKQIELNKFFGNSQWYGFTGTPLFAENARDEFGELARTTEEQYDKRLHEYTVKEAIHDRAVLGFQVEYKTTIDDFQIDNHLITRYPEVNINALTTLEKELKLDSSLFDTSAHMEQVVNSIINKSQNKLGLLNGVGHTYGGMLTTSSIDKAIDYYNLFKEVKNDEHPEIKISKSTKSKLNDFPKVAITYSVSDNEEHSVKHQNAMKEVLNDYNEMFGTNFTLETINSYNRNLNERLARKRDKYKYRDEQLDLVIVVDRLLTGFDAPSLSTLFMDRAPMKPHHLIQAFSRTNRIYEAKKKFGQIVTFQTPHLFEEAVNEALYLYSNGGENVVQAPTWEESLDEFEEALTEFRIMTPTPESMMELNHLEEMRKAASTFQRFDKAYSTVQVYMNYMDDYHDGEFEEIYNLKQDELEQFNGAYENLVEKIRIEIEGDDPTDSELPDFDIEYEIESIKTEKIDYEYILALVDSLTQSRVEEPDKDHTEKVKEITSIIEEFSRENPKLSEILLDFIDLASQNPEEFKDVKAANWMSERISEKQRNKLNEFANHYHLNLPAFEFFASNYDPEKDRSDKQIGIKELLSTADYESYRAENPNGYSKKLIYKHNLRQEVGEFVEDEILTYEVK